MRLGAADYIVKPFTEDQLEVVINRVESVRRLTSENAYLRQQETDDQATSTLIGESSPIKEVQRLILQVAPTQATVLVFGESGTGKELVARALVTSSPRANQPYVKMNCAAVPESLLESELFGHEKGAFTGAVQKRTGRFELADGGTILLDEITEMPLPLQAKLLRVLQEREFERVGGSRTISVDVRVIATTNRDLKVSVEEGKFREDLYYRLNVVPVHVAPLRDRTGDHDLLVKHFLKFFEHRHGKSKLSISEAALEMIRKANWPGNVRELQNTIERAVILALPGSEIQPSDIGILQSPKTNSHTLTSDLEDLSVENMEARLIDLALARTNGNITHAARLLGLSVRTLHYKLAKSRSAKLGTP
jgi:DNA-binding NtrC family response regulator